MCTRTQLLCFALLLSACGAAIAQDSRPHVDAPASDQTVVFHDGAAREAGGGRSRDGRELDSIAAYSVRVDFRTPAMPGDVTTDLESFTAPIFAALGAQVPNPDRRGPFPGALATPQLLIRRNTEPDGYAWTLLAVDDGVARSATRALVGRWRSVLVGNLGDARNRRTAELQKIDAQHRFLADFDQNVADLEAMRTRSGVADMSAADIDSLRMRLEQERRLNDIDVKALHASVHSATKFAENTDKPTEANLTAARLLVELNVQLAGKLTRQAALVGEISRLNDGRDALGRLESLRTQKDKAPMLLQLAEKSATEQAARIDRLEEALRAADASCHATISPIAPRK